MGVLGSRVMRGLSLPRRAARINRGSDVPSLFQDHSVPCTLRVEKVESFLRSRGRIMDSPWRLLDIPRSNHATPPLLVKYDLGSDSYTVSITDLTYLWTENLSRRQIIKRALNLETSIDPSEDASQMRLLLQHIQGAFDGREDATVTMHGDSASDELTLNASIPLPSPLPPLEWPVHCTKASQGDFATQFVLPSLALCCIAKAQVLSLLQQLKEKENVINKLIDKMQSDGTDLGRIFPGVPSSRGGTKANVRAIAAKSVRGLAEFDENQWRVRFESESEAATDIDKLLGSLFRPASLAVPQHPSQNPMPSESSRRWASRDDHYSNSSKKSPQSPPKPQRLQTREKPEANIANDFQVSTSYDAINIAPANWR